MPGRASMMHSVLLYHPIDQPLADELAAAWRGTALRSTGAPVPARVWRDAVAARTEREQTAIVLLVVSERTPRRWLRAQRDLALLQQRGPGPAPVLLPLRFDPRGHADTEVSPWASLRPSERPGRRADTLRRLAHDLDRWTDAVPEPPLGDLLERSPFPGLGPWSFAEDAWFFGRDRDIERCIAQVHGGCRWLQVDGTVGVGKTSLVRAGLMPALARPRGDHPGFGVATLRLGPRPLDDLARALLAIEQDARPGAAQALTDRLRQSPEALDRWLREQRASDRPLALVVDPFEAALSPAGDGGEDQRQLDRLLAAVMSGATGTVVVTALRSDRLDRLRVLPELEDRLNAPQTARHHLAPLGADQVDEVIRGAVGLFGGRVEDALVAAVVDGVDPSRTFLPQLSVVLRATWRHAVRESPYDPVLSADHLEAVLAPHAQPGDPHRWLDHDLEGRLDARLATLDEAPQASHPAEIARLLLLGAVEAPSGQGLATARLLDAVSERAGEDRDVVADVLSQLSSDGAEVPGVAPLVVSGAGSRVELAHQVLVDHWTTLSDWIREDADLVARQRELALLDEPLIDSSLVRLAGQDLDEASQIRYLDSLDPDSRGALEAARAEHARRAQRPRMRVRAVASALGIVAVAATSVLAWAAVRASRQTDDRRAMAIARLAESERAVHVERAMLHQIRRPRYVDGWSRETLEVMVHPAPRRTLYVDDAPGTTFARHGDTLAVGSERGPVILWDLGGPTEPVRLEGPDAAVRALAISPDGVWVAAGVHDGTAWLWNVEGEARPRALHGHEGPVHDIAFGPSGERLVTASHDATARIWTVDGEVPPLVLRGHGNWVSAARFVPDGGAVVTGSHDGTARWWTLPESDAEPTFVEARVGSGWVERLYPDRLEDAVVLTSTDGDLLVWNKGERPVPYVGHDSEITDVAVEMPSERPVLWSASVDGSLVRWEGPDSTTLRQLEPGEPFGLSVEDGEPRLLSADGVVVRVIGGDAEVRLHHGATEVREAAFGREGEVLTLGDDGAVRVWPLPRSPSGTGIGLPEHALRDGGMAGGVVFAGGEDGALRLWRPDGRPLPQAFPGAPADDRATTDEGASTWATVVDGQVRIGWRRGGRPSRVLEPRSGAVRRALVGPAGDHVAILTEAGQVEVWTLDSDEPPRTLRAPSQHTITDLAFAASGSRLATVSKEGDLQLWTTFSEVPLQTRGPIGIDLRRVAISEDGSSTVVAGATDGSVVWWEPASESIERWSMGVDAIETLLLGGDDVRLLTVDEHGRAVLSDRSAGRWTLWRTESSCRVRSADLTRDGRLAAVACDSGEVRVWEEDTRPFELTTLEGAARTVRFERGGTRLVITSEAGRLYVVEPTHEALRDELMAGVEPCLVPGERRDYLAETPAIARARWRGCEEACWNRGFPDDAEVDARRCPVDRADPS